MLSQCRLYAVALFLAFACALFMPGTIQSQIISAEAYSVSPNPAPAAVAFKLSLLGGKWNSLASFSRESVLVTGSRIDLSFVVRQIIFMDPPIWTKNPPVVDTVFTLPAVAPVFSMPALKAGKYEVWATQMYECLYTKPPCEMAVTPKYAGVLEVSQAGAITYSINPTKTLPGKDFNLNLLSYQFNCAVTYDMLSATVNGNNISLTFLDHEAPVGSICPAIYMPYGPRFNMAALKAGTYTVTAYRLPACAAQGCKMAPTPGDAGTLVVEDVSRKTGWFLKNNQVTANTAFSMQVVNNQFGNCQTSFSNQTVSVLNGEIHTRFFPVVDSNRVCIVNIVPWGPSFDMAALKPGKYPLYVTQLPACLVKPPFCKIPEIPVLSDTLTVTGTTGMLVQPQRTTKPSAYFQGGRLHVTLLEPSHSSSKPLSADATWKLELIALSGRVQSRYTFNVDGDLQNGGALSLDAGGIMDKGVYLLQLHSPTGELQSIPVIQRE